MIHGSMLHKVIHAVPPPDIFDFYNAQHILNTNQVPLLASGSKVYFPPNN